MALTTSYKISPVFAILMLFAFALAVARISSAGCNRHDVKPAVHRPTPTREQRVAPDPDEMVPICNIAPDPKVGSLVEQLLASANIPCTSDGTIVYVVKTPRRYAAKAANLIKTDAKQKGYWVEFK